MDLDERQLMMRDIGLQAVIIFIVIYLFLAMHGVPQRLLAKFRFRNRASTAAKRHFVKGAQLLTQARSSSSTSTSAARSRSASTSSLAKEALAEAEKAIALDPKDAASYLLKAMVLDLQGYRTSALESLDAALSPLAARSLAASERGDALLKRGELRLATSQRGRVDPALSDLSESVKLSPRNVKAWCLLGECYEGKKMEEEAKKAYQEALQLEPELPVAQEAIKRLGSS